MIRDITIGQYYPADSVLHRLDPRTKFIGTFIYLVSLFVADSFWGYVIATFFGRVDYFIKSTRKIHAQGSEAAVYYSVNYSSV